MQETPSHSDSRHSPKPFRAVPGILRVRVATVCAGSFGFDVEDLLTGPLMVFVRKGVLLPPFASEPHACSSEMFGPHRPVK